MAEPRHRLVPDGACRPLHRVNMTVHYASGILRLRVSRAERVVDSCKAVRDLGDVLRSHERIERARNEIGWWRGPSADRPGLSNGEALDRPAYGERGLRKRFVFSFAEASFETQHGTRKFRLSGEACRPLQGVHCAPGRLECRVPGLLALGKLIEREEMALELLEEDPSQLWIAHERQVSGSSSPSSRRKRGSRTGLRALTTNACGTRAFKAPSAATSDRA